MKLPLFGLLYMLLWLANTAVAHDRVALASAVEVNKHKASISWFTNEKIDSHIWKINDNQQDNIYLVEGEKSALIVDTGLGYQNLKSYVRTITDKPLYIVNTHAHPDHAGGNHVFKHVHIHKDELETLRFYTSEPVMRDTFIRFAKIPMPEHLLDRNRTPSTMVTIEDGFRFNLGKRTIDVIHIPGHSPGSIALYDNQSKVMFTGDMANQHIWLQVKHATTVNDFLSSIKKLQTYRSSVDWLLPGHGEPLKPKHLDVLEAAAEKLRSGKCDVIPYSSPLGEEISCHHEGVVIVYKKQEQ